MLDYISRALDKLPLLTLSSVYQAINNKPYIPLFVMLRLSKVHLFYKRTVLSTYSTYSYQWVQNFGCAYNTELKYDDIREV